MQSKKVRPAMSSRKQKKVFAVCRVHQMKHGKSRQKSQNQGLDTWLRSIRYSNLEEGSFTKVLEIAILLRQFNDLFFLPKKNKKSGHLLLLLVRRLHNVLFFIFGFFGVYGKTFCGVCVLDQLTKKIKTTIGRYY